MTTTESFPDVGTLKGSSTSGDGAAWGLASLWLGAVPLLVAPVMLIFNLLLWQSPRSPDPRTGVVTLILAVLGVATMLGLAGCGISFGLKGRRVDRGLRPASPLATAGVLLGTAACVGWFIVGVQIAMIVIG
jgi:hypothetical protein